VVDAVEVTADAVVVEDSLEAEVAERRGVRAALGEEAVLREDGRALVVGVAPQEEAAEDSPGQVALVVSPEGVAEEAEAFLREVAGGDDGPLLPQTTVCYQIPGVGGTGLVANLKLECRTGCC
jgi:hypothetical protein